MESWYELKMGRKGEGGCCRGVNENYHKIYPNIYCKIYLNKLTKFLKTYKKVNNKKSSFDILIQIGEDHYPLAERVSSWITWWQVFVIICIQRIWSFHSSPILVDLRLIYVLFNLSTFIVTLSFELIPKLLFNVGTFILITFGNASVAQSVLSLGNKGDFFSVNWG